MKPVPELEKSFQNNGLHGNACLKESDNLYYVNVFFTT